MEFTVKKDSTYIILDKGEFSGVKKAAGWLALDFGKVTGFEPEIKEREGYGDAALLSGNIIAGTISRSSLIEKAAADKGIDLSAIKGKREVYGIFITGDSVIVAGSDKRGTIYGLLHISEAIGISPLDYFGDTVPVKYKGICLGDVKRNEEGILYTDPSGVSREPSVKYRGFFINDEWPAFGNWCNRHFKGFTAACYEKVFEYLLRLKGNYLWPAMWSAIFSMDGPDLASAELADELGVVMGTSHHEPCCRAGEEFQKLKKTHPEYGNDWSFITNREGVTKFWEDGLKRNARFENVITVGMRGEADSKLMADARLSDNINVLKDVINCQKDLISKYTDGKQPLMLAVYKEVEEFYKGDDSTEGLKNWEGLDGITLMLCDDNFGNLRLMMDDDKREHKGGYGMYYHFDYHGGPVSFEWINSSYLPKIWEQMTTAYDYGIRDIWIVNVGDLKNQELPLSYFMDLAYDFDKYGTENPGNYVEYLSDWVDRNFANFDEESRKSVLEITDGYTRLNNIVKPEVMNDNSFSLTGFNEAYRVLSIAKSLERKTENLIAELSGEQKDTFMSLVGYQALASFNLIKMHIFAAYNKRNAIQGRVSANRDAGRTKKCIEKDKKIVEDFHTMLGGKWYGMGMSKHIGFRAWNEEGCRLPVMMYVEAEAHNDVVVTDEDSNTFTGGGVWTRRPLRLTGFDHKGSGHFSISTAGTDPVTYTIECNDSSISFSGRKNEFVTSGIASAERDVYITVNASKDAAYGRHEFNLKTSAGNIKVFFDINENTLADSRFEDGVNYFNGNAVSIPAANYCALYERKDGVFKSIESFGRLLPGETGCAIKAYPQDRIFEDGPLAEYRLYTPVSGKYKLKIFTAPSNPAYVGNRISFKLTVNLNEPELINTVPEGFIGGETTCRDWCIGVIENVRYTETEIELNKGHNVLTFKAVDPGFVLEKMVISRYDMNLPESRLGAI